MSSTEGKGLLWQLVSEVAALNAHVAVDTGTQTDMARYHAIVPLGLVMYQHLLVCLCAVSSVTVLSHVDTFLALQCS